MIQLVCLPTTDAINDDRNVLIMMMTKNRDIDDAVIPLTHSTGTREVTQYFLATIKKQS